MPRLADWPLNVVLAAVAAIPAACGLGIWFTSESSAELTAEGKTLFVHEWEVRDSLSSGGDGLGPVFNAKSCVACHFQGGVGGGGDLQHNVTSFEVLPSRNNEEISGGVVHAAATEAAYKETTAQVRELNPVVEDSTRVIGGCQVSLESFDPVSFESINTPALFGVGLIDDIAGSSIKWTRHGRNLSKLGDEFNLEFSNAGVGRVRKLRGGSVGKFGWKGQFATLEEFVATACAVELGLTNPMRAQDVPTMHVPDDNAELDMTHRQLKSLVEFCRNLPRPEQVLPRNMGDRARVANGEKLFAEIGCADCHTKAMDGVEGVYSDFLLHSVEDPSAPGYREVIEVPVPDSHPKPNEWQTPPLWGVADSAPYFHDGQSPDLEAAIDRHSGDAAGVRDKYRALSGRKREDILRFLRTLRAPRVIGTPQAQ